MQMTGLGNHTVDEVVRSVCQTGPHLCGQPGRAVNMEQDQWHESTLFVPHFTSGTQPMSLIPTPHT